MKKNVVLEESFGGGSQSARIDEERRDSNNLWCALLTKFPIDTLCSGLHLIGTKMFFNVGRIPMASAFAVFQTQCFPFVVAFAT